MKEREEREAKKTYDIGGSHGVGKGYYCRGHPSMPFRSALHTSYGALARHRFQSVCSGQPSINRPLACGSYISSIGYCSFSGYFGRRGRLNPSSHITEELL